MEEIKISLKKLAGSFNIEFDFILQKLNQLIGIDPRIEEFIIDINDEKYILKDGLIILLPFLKLEDSKKNLFAILALIIDMEAQKFEIISVSTH
ncbi:hypothetical protein [Viridibacillus sp. FSL R5-0888]|uniref:hypothetical protein n=1 Tax=Viridibacillus sp. FSL R5-0888 TaxID=2921663 RepID=UPI0030F7F439